YAHKPFAEACAAHLRPGQVVVLMPGTLGSLEFARLLRERGAARGVVLAETDTAPYVCRKVTQAAAHIWGVVSGLGLGLLPVDEAFHAAGFGPKGDLWATINGSRMLTQLRAPGALETRWLTEDVPYGLAAWAELGAQFGVSCPTLRALVELTSAALGVDFWKAART